MPHTPLPPFKGVNARLSEVRKLLDDNQQLLAQTKYTTARNTNEVLRYLVETISRVEVDLRLLHNKLQPVLKSLKDDSPEQIWRDRDE